MENHAVVAIMNRTIELAPGITASVSPDVSEATVAAFLHVALSARHREIHGFLSGDPLEIKDGIDYEHRRVRCASCGARMPHAPWPTNSDSFANRPRCGKCNSPMTYPEA